MMERLMKTTIKTSHKSQAGLVSIIVTLIVMLVLSLIVIGFANFTRRDQRQTLDRQLNTQALYAAETGINDAIEILSDVNNRNALGGANPYTGCNDFITAVSGLPPTINPIIDADSNVKYTCLLVDIEPKKLVYTNVSQYTAKVVPIQSGGGVNIASIKIAWQNTANSEGMCNRDAGASIDDRGANPPLIPYTDWEYGSPGTCPNGMLRIDMVCGADPCVNSRNLLTQTNMTAFVFPRTTGGGGALDYKPLTSPVPNNKVVRVNGKCDRGLTPGIPMCSITITPRGIFANSVAAYYLRIQSLYRNSNIEITAQNLAGDDLELHGVQAVIDSTGKAQDVLKRIQVRQPLFVSSSDVPTAAINVGSTLCKLLTVIPDETAPDICGLP
jgi:hypothetical protein